MHQIDLPDWAVERGRRMNCFDHINPARTALIAVDMQNAFTLAGQIFENPHACDIIPSVNRLAAAMRAAGGQVVWTRQTVTRNAPYAYPEWHYDADNPFVRRAIDALTDGAEGHRLHGAVEIGDADIVLNKYRYSAFIQNASEIDARL
ncbi:MAG: rutB 2, partial [Rhodospirillales bacterium]|nr:rutB 2 [Rhodospirillales bacterium]